MQLNLRCVPLIQDFDPCICRMSLKTCTKIIGWVTLVISLCISMWCALRLSPFQKNEFLTAIKVSGGKEFFMLQLLGHMTMATLSFLLLLGVHCDIPILMLPSLLVQLFVETTLTLMHPMAFLFSGASDMRYGLLAVTTCITFIGFVTFLWIVQYNCYRKFVEKHRRAYEEAIKAMSQYPESVMYHTQGSQDDYSAFSAIVAMNVVAMISAEG